jgi:AraC-like DNA-binding protein
MGEEQIMEESTYRAVEKVIAAMWERYGEQLSLDDLADEALLSKFYLSRVFHAVTGTSPFRFLTAIRLYEAKRLLRESPLNVTDVACCVGYSSLGTFTSRFTRSVGLSPGRYRSLSRAGLPPIAAGRANGDARMRGTVTVPRTDCPVRVYVGAFKSPIMEGQPASWDVLESSGTYTLTGPSEGVWFVRAAAVAVRDADRCPWSKHPVFVGGSRPVQIAAGRCLHLNMFMKKSSSLDLPVVLALPELDRHSPPAEPAGLSTWLSTARLR